MNIVDKVKLKGKFDLTYYFVKEIKRDIKTMEKYLYANLESSEPLLTKSSTHLLKSGGKRIRPALLFLSAKNGLYDLERLFPMAMSLEIIHMASLIHDDIVDIALVRRGNSTVKAEWGNEVSVYTGGHLLSRAMTLVSAYNDRKINRTLSSLSLEMVKGELSQMGSLFTLEKSIRPYLSRIRRKTALLLSASCEFGAYIADADNSIIRAMKIYGDYLGMAFQIIDDNLDYESSDGKSGKVIGGDIRQGLNTLPLIYALNHSPEKHIIEEIFPKKIKTDDEVNEIVRIVRESNGCQFAYDLAKTYIDKAKQHLYLVKDDKLRASFENMADFVVKRDH